jgi:toxin-antitoxin system PIN domain toxin
LTWLLDVNVLVALFDASHLNHEAAHEWFAEEGVISWATCPITENGFIRVLSHPSYPSVKTTPNDAAERLAAFVGQQGHSFWADDISLLADPDSESRARLIGSLQVTDFYLAALALHHGGLLATFDGSLLRSLKGTRLGAALHLLS